MYENVEVHMEPSAYIIIRLGLWKNLVWPLKRFIWPEERVTTPQLQDDRGTSICAQPANNDIHIEQPQEHRSFNLENGITI